MVFGFQVQIHIRYIRRSKMEYSELSNQEKSIWDRVYAISYSKHHDAYYAIGDANKAIYDLRSEMKRLRK